MTPMAHRLPPCGADRCATCQRNRRRDAMFAALVLIVFVAVFVLRLAVPA